MRRPFVVVAALCLSSPAAAQSFTRDWRPEQRTVIGDFNRISAIATSSDRVYIVSPSAVLTGTRSSDVGRDPSIRRTRRCSPGWSLL